MAESHPEVAELRSQPSKRPPPVPVSPTTSARRGVGPATVLTAFLVAAGGFLAFYLVEHRPKAQALSSATLELADVRRSRDSLEAQVIALTEERDALQARVGELRTTEEVLRRERDSLRRESESLRIGAEQAQAALAAMQEAQTALRERLGAELASGEVELREHGGSGLSVALGDRILFPPGQAELNARGRSVLQRVIAAVSSLSDRRIRVEGHTDATPITGENMERFPTNWELSTARATTVVRFLEQQGIGGERMVAVGYGPHRPVADNDTPRGRLRNRRIEIVLERATVTEGHGSR